MALHIFDEAQRCLQCKKPLCRKGCPINTPIPEFIALLKEGEIRQAGQKIFWNNPLSVVCSLVCPHEKFCEGHCILGKKSTPIHISAIEQYISDYNLDMLTIPRSDEYQGKVAVVGGGPSGIALAFFMASWGYDVTVYEQNERIGGVLRYGIPKFRLPVKHIDRLEKRLREIGVKIQPNIVVGPMVSVDDLFRDGHDAIFMATGVWKPRKLGVIGDTLGHVHFAINYLKNPDAYELGDTVVVIGAGNVAMDVARTALRAGSRHVYIMHRKGAEQISASPDEVEYAKMDGAIFRFYEAPLEIDDRGIFYEDVSEAAVHPNRHFLACDAIIVAISQGPLANIVSTTEGIAVDERGQIIIDETYATTREGIFAGGDVVSGARTVVEAAAAAKEAANHMHRYIQSIKHPDVAYCIDLNPEGINIIDHSKCWE